VHLVFRDLEHEEMLLAEPLEVANILFANNMSFFKCAPLEFPGPYLGYIMRKDRAYGLTDRDRLHGSSAAFVYVVTHRNLQLEKLQILNNQSQILFNMQKNGFKTLAISNLVLEVHL
jgi:hypothetical protein